jgi:large subunit ribosomal protein L25
MMKLPFTEREAERKCQAKALRREGLIPAVIYHRSKPAETVTVNSAEFTTLLRQVPAGRLSTTIFTLVSPQGLEKKAIIKDIQYNPVNYSIIHLDFEELIEDVSVNVKVPIECVGVVDCVGIKLGGFLRQVIRHLRINCLPKDIPTHFQINVESMGIFESKRIKDLPIPATVRPLANLNEVVVVIAKR